jgi:hypothetical protein
VLNVEDLTVATPIGWIILLASNMGRLIWFLQSFMPDAVSRRMQPFISIVHCR